MGIICILPWDNKVPEICWSWQERMVLKRLLNSELLLLNDAGSNDEKTLTDNLTDSLTLFQDNCTFFQDVLFMSSLEVTYKKMKKAG